LTDVRPVAGSLLVVYAAVVAFIVFSPSAEVPTDSVAAIWEALGEPAWLSGSAVEFVTNVLLFVPLSLLGSAFRPGWGWAAWLAAGLACSILIESSQALFLPGRSPEPVDLVANTLGAGLGYLGATLLRRAWAARG
jgi:glycopeptide antibiotics resistance protein